jgi:hypothetical protein
VDRGTRALRIPTPSATTAPEALGSLYSTAGLRKALDQLPGGRVTMLALRADSLDATLTRQGNTTVVHLTADGDVSSASSPVSLPGKSVKVDPAAPARIIRTLKRRRAGTVTNMVLIEGAWRVTTGKGIYEASVSGKRVKRLA